MRFYWMWYGDRSMGSGRLTHIPLADDSRFGLPLLSELRYYKQSALFCQAMDRFIFHLAFPVSNLEQTKEFYIDGLGCEAGRESPHSLIMNLYGHQIVAQVTDEPLSPQKGIYPRHFGLVFTRESDWEELCDRARSRHLTFFQQPKRRFPGMPLDHRTFFLSDPFHNLLEFKFYAQPSAVFGESQLTLVGDRA